MPRTNDPYKRAARWREECDTEYRQQYIADGTEYSEQEAIGAALQGYEYYGLLQAAGLEEKHFFSDKLSTIYGCVTGAYLSGMSGDAYIIKLQEDLTDAGIQMSCDDLKGFSDIVPAPSLAQKFAVKILRGYYERSISYLASPDGCVWEGQIIETPGRNDLRAELTSKLAALDKGRDAGGQLDNIEGVSADNLAAAAIPDPVIFVGNEQMYILTEGIFFLNAFAKVGKSRLLLQLQLALAAGKPFLGMPVLQCDCLYLAWEDDDADTHSRLNSFKNAGTPIVPGLVVLTQEDMKRRGFETMPTLDKKDEDGRGGLIKFLRNYLKRHPDTRFIGIDVLDVVKSRVRNKDLALAERDDVESLKDIAREFHACVMVAHHTGKGQFRQDMQAGGSKSATGSGAGSYSYAAAATGEWNLSRDPDRKGYRRFFAAGRRGGDHDFYLKDEFPMFSLEGTAEQVDAEKAADSTKIIQDNLKVLFADYCRNGSRYEFTAKDLIDSSNINCLRKDVDVLPITAKLGDVKAILTDPMTVKALLKDGIRLAAFAKKGSSLNYYLEKFDTEGVQKNFFI